ncbi:MAG: hypothetical protein ACI83B_001834 [Sediminicola sp.]|jgi:hypothetical protein
MNMDITMKIITLLVVLLTSAQVLAEGPYTYQIADSTENMKKLKRLDSASIKYVNPEEGDSDYDIIIGYKGTFSEKEINNWLFPSYIAERAFSFTIDVDRDTLTKEPRNNYSVGVSWDFEFTKEPDLNSPSYQRENATFFDIGVEAKYKKDEEKDIESAELKLNMTPFNFFNAGALRTLPFTKSAKFYQGMVINISYEDTIDSPKNEDGGSTEGHASRTWITESFKIYPFFSSLKEQVELAYTGEFGTDLATTGIFSNKDDTWVYNKASLNYYFTCDKTWSIGLDYVNGEQRRKNKEDDSETAISLKFKWPASEDEVEYCSS